jgi:hypothetical protein
MTAPAQESLQPLIDALRASASAEADQLRAAAAAAAAELIDAAQRQADGIVAQARSHGAADALAIRALALMRARRQARALRLAAARGSSEELRDRCRQAARALTAEPGFPRLRERLAQRALATLGSGAVLHDCPDGGVVGQRPGRRMNLSLTTFVDQAVDELAWRLFDEPAAAGRERR